MASRELIKWYEGKIEAIEMELKAQDKVITLSAEQTALMQKESDALRAALKGERTALVKKELEADQLRKDLAKATKKKNFFKRLFITTSAILAAGAAVVILKE